MKIEVYPRLTMFGRRWFFRVRASNGEPIAQSEAYRNRADAVATLMSMRSQMFDAQVVNL